MDSGARLGSNLRASSASSHWAVRPHSFCHEYFLEKIMALYSCLIAGRFALLFIHHYSEYP